MKVVNNQVAYILHKRAYRETSSILDVFTRDHGRVSLMARGTRGARSKIAGNLLLFTPLVISWQGKSNLPYLKSVERADIKAPALKSKSLLSAMYVNELLTYFLHQDDVNEPLFEQYHECLYSLVGDSNVEISLRKFEIKLLELLGFGLNLYADADNGEAIQAEIMYHYFPEHGPVVGAGSNPNLPRVSGACLLQLVDENFQGIAENAKILAELKQLMRYLINYHLGNKTLKSRELFKPIISV